ncbi:aminoglycoside nucleotidyltransferase ANT9 [Brucella anthropi]|uniref:aminoglycoside nucleotidyltransferase ANT9 n=1 Tax=Brucella anthropi TaxID=529 RepID=UPI0005B8EAD0|nr:aminoglycoside nucleotidyltransferase ANT9 [Brucella anthropi]KIU67100.1 adenylyltransferase [Brucella anthropi]
MQTEKSQEQISTVVAALRNIFGNSLIAVYLHGSGVSGELRPQSDIDLLAVVDRSTTEDERAVLLASLLPLSGRHPAVQNGPRCLEVMVFSRIDLARRLYPARAEFIFGEWLRDAFEAGEAPMPQHDPEFTLVLAQARQEASPLFGPDASELLPDVPEQVVRDAMRDLLPTLLTALNEDTRNVLLTLARMWRTASSGTFVGKNEAAIWALPELDEQDASTLDYARQAYLGEVQDDDWQNRRDAAKRLAEQLALNVTEAMAS